MHYYVNPVLFYVSATRTPTGVVVTDNKNYYIMLIPHLFPKKLAGLKIHSSMSARLANNELHLLKNYDSHSTSNDAIFLKAFLIDN